MFSWRKRLFEWGEMAMMQLTDSILVGLGPLEEDRWCLRVDESEVLTVRFVYSLVRKKFVGEVLMDASEEKVFKRYLEKSGADKDYCFLLEDPSPNDSN